jgi:hypothetical protein
MNDTEKLNIVLEAGAARRDDRRRFLRQASSVAVAAGATSLLAACGGGDDDKATPTPTPTSSVTPTPTSTATSAIGDGDILNFALNLEYLEAQFYSFAATGAGLPAASLAAGSAATGTPGTVTGGKQVTFGDALVGQYAREIAADERAHVDFLRKTIGTTVVPMPNINIAGGAGGAFTAAARAAGIVVDDSYDPYKDDNSFLLAAYIFEDVGVTAYKGAAPLLRSKTFLEAAAGLLAAEAYHSAIIRTTLSRKGLFVPAQQISDARDGLDGGIDRDQGIGSSAADTNIVPTDGDGIAFSRSPGQVLNIVYLNRTATTSGGFFPNGVNAANPFFKTSAAS